MKIFRVLRLSAMVALPAMVLGSMACGTAGSAVPAATDLGFVAPGLPADAPEAVGMSTTRLERLSRVMQQLVDDERLAGITTMVARRGQVVQFETFGHRDIEAGAPMSEDTIFRIYSMSKPITGVALMLLYEEGLFRLSDPVSKYIPEFDGLQVIVGEGASGSIVADADHPMTIRELMSHTAGLNYGFSDEPLDRMYRDAKVLDRTSTLRDMILKLGDLPLAYQPGSRWRYSVAVDVQGYLVEVLSGEPFDEFLQERLFGPLGMVDTAFWVPPEKVSRFAEVYTYDDDDALVVRQESDPNYLEPVPFFSGGGGLVSTTADYMRFCQMVLNGGELNGVRIVSPLTVDLMRRNQLPRELAEMSPGVGFGLDFAVVIDPVEADGISAGEYYWGGAAGTWFWIDPVEDLIFVGMIQQFGVGRPDVRSLSRRVTYQALLESSTNWTSAR